MRRPSPSLLLALAAACACQDPPAPVITAVQPPRASNGVDTSLTVLGAHFLADVKADMDDPALSQVNAGFALTLLGTGGAQAALTGVTLVSDGEIRATLPAGALPGTYDLHLVDPRGRTADLPSALLVYASSCASPPAADGTPCDDGNPCTLVDACLNGACVGWDPVACAPLDDCHPGVCDPATGLCSNPPAPDGSPCRLACIAGESCQAGACALPITGCTNTAPLACLLVTPASGPAGATTFTADASCSSDLETPTFLLTLQVDFGDPAGTYAWQASPATHVYASPGLKTASAVATDTGLPPLAGYAQLNVLVYDPLALVLVTTAADENDAGATPTSPGGTGLSLREAITYVDTHASPPAGPWTIGFDTTKVGPGPIGFTTPLPPLTAPGATLVGLSDASGLPAVQLDFSAGNVGGSNKPCLTLGGPNQLLAWLLVTGCNGTGVLLAPGSAGSQVTECRIEAPAGALSTSVGLSAQDSGTIGPRNLMTGWATGIAVAGAAGLVDGNAVRENGVGLAVAGVPAGSSVAVQRNRVWGNAAVGASLGTSSGSLLVRHNLFHANGTDGLSASGPTLVVRDNLFTGNGHFGVNAARNDFAGGGFDHNGFFANAKGNTNVPLTTGATDVLADPLYVNAASGDFRLAPDSPDVNAGIDTGLDVNGPAPGLYNGSLPDIGPEETPY